MNVLPPIRWPPSPAAAPYPSHVRPEDRVLNTLSDPSWLNTEQPGAFLSLFASPGLPNRPGTPEIPQKYNNTALVVWRPSDTMAPCTYSLEKRTEGPISHTLQQRNAFPLL